VHVAGERHPLFLVQVPEAEEEVQFIEAAGRITITVRDALGNPLIVAERQAATGR